MTDRPNLTRVWASSGEITDPADKYPIGFVQEKPAHGIMNGLFNSEDTFFLSLAERGVLDTNSKDTLVTLAQGAVFSVDKDDSVILQINTPEGALDSLAGNSDSGFIDSVYQGSEALSEHMLDTGNPHNVTAAQANTYDKPKVDLELSKVLLELDNHIKDKGNPHKVTATQIGSVPVTGGSFKGEVYFPAEGNILSDMALQADSRLSITTDGKGLGISSDKLPVYISGSDEHVLVSEDTYDLVREKVDSKYSVPPPDVEFSYSCASPHMLRCPDLTYEGDTLNVDSVKGLKLEGKVSFDGSDFIARENTYLVRFEGDVTLNSAYTSIKSTGTKIIAEEKFELVPLVHDYTSGVAVVVKGVNKAYLYVNGVLVDEKDSTYYAPADLVCSLEGTGYVKGIKIWSLGLTKEQIAALA